MTIYELLPAYLEYLQIEKDRTRETIGQYALHLQRFAEYTHNIDLRKLTYDHTRGYRQWLKDTYKVSDSVCSTHLVVVREFLRYADRRKIKTLAASRVEVGNYRNNSKVFLYPEEVKAMVAATTKPRDKLIIKMLFDSGMRVSELTAITAREIDFLQRQVQVRGKGGKDRLVFFRPATAASMKRWYAKHDTIGVTDRTVQRIVTAAAKRAGIKKKVTPHTERHSFATNLLNNGADIRALQVMLGHASVLTTEGYTHMANPRLRETYRTCAPRALAQLI